MSNATDIFAAEDEQNPLAPYTQSEAEKKLAERITKRYQAGVDYKTGQGFYERWGEYDRFWNGDQWPESTAATSKMPRPVTNHFAKIIEQKVAAITYEPSEIYYEPVEGDTINTGEQAENIQDADKDAADVLSQVAKFEYQRLDMEELNDGAVRNAATLCNGIWFFPWDNSLKGGGRRSKWRGNVTGYVIDPSDFYPGDPTNHDIQSQPWIIITERKPLSAIKADKSYSPAVIASLEPSEANDASDRPYSTQDTEQDETGCVDLLHCFWKEPVPEEDEEADEEAAEKTAVAAAPDATLPATLDDIPLTEEEILLATLDDIPLTEEEQKPTVNLHYAVVCEKKLLRHEEYLYKHGLYPFASFQWYPRRYSFFGKPESADIIANQKEANRLAGIALYAAYTSGVPDIEYNSKWIDRRDLDGGFGGRLIENKNPSGSTNGLQIHQASAASTQIPQMMENMVTGMNDVSGVQEAFTGKAPGSDLNASAIIALQEAAGVRIKGIQRRFTRALQDVGRIWLAHWKEFFEEPRLIRITGDDDETGYMWFTGTEYADMEFDVHTKGGSASPFNKSLYLSLLDKMLEGGIIGPDEYLEFLPADVFPKVQQVMERRKEKQMEQQAMQLETKIAMMKQAISQVLTEAKANGVPITPEALQMMTQLVQQIAVEEAQMQADEAQQGGGKMSGIGGGEGGEMPGLPGLPNMGKPQVQGGLV